MTLIEIVVILLWLTLGTVLGVSFAVQFGPLGGFLGSLLGFVGIPGLLLLTGWAWTKWRPELPICANGRCRSTGYRLTRFARGGVVFTCSCDVDHLLSTRRFLRTRSFRVLYLDGSTSPYRCHRPFGRWRPDLREEKTVKSPYRS